MRHGAKDILGRPIHLRSVRGFVETIIANNTVFHGFVYTSIDPLHDRCAEVLRSIGQIARFVSQTAPFPMSHTPHTAQTAQNRPNQPPLRVAHLIKGLGPGGAERLIVNQLETADPNIDYTVLRLIGHKSHLVSAVEATGATSMLIGGGRLWPLALRKKLAALDPDVIHAHSPVLAIAARLLISVTNIDAAILTTEHNRWPRHHRVTRLGNRLTAARDTARIAVSEDVRQSMSTSLHATTEVLDHGVPLGPLVELRAKRPEMRARLLGDAADSTIVIGIVANFRPEKAYDVFLDAAEQLAARRSGIRFFVVGQGPGEAAFRHGVRERGLDSVIEVLGYRDDATEVMSAFDIFTLTSRHEGKPVSLMEAFALGVPVVATRAGGIPEAVTDGENGILVDIDDTSAVSNAWERLANDDALRTRMGQAAAASAVGFDAAVATRSIESVYRSIAGRG